MELEELKAKIIDTSVKYSRTELEQIFQLRTKRTIHHINRKMLIDLLVMIFTTVLLVTITFMMGLRSRYMVSGQIIGFSLLTFIHYQIKYVLINWAIDYDFGIREGALKLLVVLRNYILAYKIILPVICFILMIKHLWDLAKNWNVLISEWPLIITVTIAGYFAAWIAVKLLYTGSVKKLERIVSTME